MINYYFEYLLYRKGFESIINNYIIETEEIILRP